MADGGLKAPVLDWSAPDIAEAFRLFKQRINLYFKIKKTPEKEQAWQIVLNTGDEGIRRFNCWGLTEEEAEKPKTIFERFEEQLEPEENFRVCRLKLSKFRQLEKETVDDFVNRCRLMANKCDFGKTEFDDRLIELIIAGTPIPDLQRKLLEQPKGYTLKQAVTEARKFEAADAHANQIKEMNSLPTPVATSETQVAAMSQSRPTSSTAQSSCKNCGRHHVYGRDNCPAKDSVCDSCGKVGHWAHLCITTQYRARQHGQPPQPRQPRRQFASQPSQPLRGRGRRAPPARGRRTVNAISGNDQYEYQHDYDSVEDYPYPQDDFLDHQLESLNFSMVQVSTMARGATSSRDEAFVNLSIRFQFRPGTHNFRLKVDTGAQGNTMPSRIFDEMFPEERRKYAIEPSFDILTAYNNTVIPCKGIVRLDCKFGDSEFLSTPFYVVDVPGPAILGLPTCEALKVVTLHCAVNANVPAKSSPRAINCTADLVRAYPGQFDQLGKFDTVHHLRVDPDVPAHIDPPRRIPISLKDKVKAELDKMENQGVIRKIVEPTEWVSSLTYVSKKDGSIRVCLDPRHLNRALIRPYHPTNTVEELSHKFSGSKYFSKLDAKAGYWAVQLDPQSQKLTTFQSPFGRYCFTRLPFGLSVSQDIFQLEMDRILMQCKGACGIADDIVVFGKDETEHDANLTEFMAVAAKHGLTLNSKKCDIKTSKVEFFGNIYTPQGMSPDPQKVKDLQEMQRPSNRTELQQYLGFTNYLSKFVKNYSSKITVLRELLQKECDFIWEAHHQRCFEDLKASISEKCVLRYYDPTKPLVIHCDASLKGIGAAMLQPGDDGSLEPVAYASKSLSACEQRYACIERELLAIVFATQRFHQFVFGRKFSIITDHKPLVMIMDKPLTAAPARLQRMLVALQGYNFDLSFEKGVNHALADGLSRFPNDANKEPVDLDVRVDFVRFSDQKLVALRQCTASDPIFNQLREIITIGWPATIKELPQDLRPFWGLRDVLSVENGIIVKGNQVMIPPQLRRDILKQLHTPHLGQEKTKLLAKETVYWPGINSDIDNLIKACTTCQRHMPSQAAEPLLQHEVPSRPWSVLGTDLFEEDGKHYLIIADYYSKTPIIRLLPTPSPSSVVVKLLKEIFSEYGIPDKVVSDNGPHFDSEAFRMFAKSWGFDHTTSSPRRPQGNGFIERQIQTVKHTMVKARESGIDLDLAMLYLRSTPVSHKLPNPAEMLMGR